jgi:hypothetical protein
MTDVAAAGNRAAWRGRMGAEPVAARPSLDARRALQLVLAAIWLLDGVLQYQGFMFTKGFSQMLAGTANGNPAVIAKPITWDATLIEHHMVLLNTVFATIQLLLGLGIAFRPTARAALAASMVYMFAAITAGGGMAGMGGMPKLHVPTLAFLFALILIGYTIWDLDQLSGLLRGFVAAAAGVASPALVGASAGAFGTEAVAGSGAGGLAAGSPAGSGGTGHGRTAGGDRIGALSILDSPEIVVGCRIAMGVSMALLLILMF